MNTQTLIQKLESIASTKYIKIYVPSLDNEVEFKPLTVQQQKTILKASLDRNLSALTLPLTFNKIIKDNIMTPSPILTTDKSHILLSLRAQTLGNIVTRVIKADLDQKPETEEIDILPYVISTRQPLPTELRSVEVEVGLWTLHWGIPTLEEETEIYELAKSKMKDINDIDFLSQNISDIYIFELAKFFIKAVEMDGETIHKKDLSKTLLLQFIEKLHSSTIKEVLDYTRKIKDHEDSQLVLNGQRIKIDGTLFN